MNRRGISVGVLALAAAHFLGAQGTDGSWQLSGFGTLGVAAGSTHQVTFRRDWTQPDGVQDRLDGRVDTRLGLQYSGWFSEKLYGSLQVISKYRYDGTFRPEVNTAFLGWNPVPQLALRAGRLNVEYNLAGDSRDVGYSFLFVRPPVEFYSRNADNKYHGLDAAFTFAPAAGQTLRVKAWGGTLAEEQVPVRGGGPFDLTGNPVGGVILDWQAGPWRAKGSWGFRRTIHAWPAKIQSLPDLLADLAPLLNEPKLLAAAQELSIKGTRIRAVDGVLAYEEGPLQAQVNAQWGTTSPGGLLPKWWSGYASVGYRVGEVVPYVVYSWVGSPRVPVPDLGSLPQVSAFGAQLAGYVRDAVYYGQTNQATLAGGLRWDFRPKAALKFQVDHIRAFHSEGLWLRDQPGWDGKATVFSVTLDFVFGGGR